MSITIRKAVLSDLPVLITLQQKLAFETEGVQLDPGILEKGLKAMFQDHNKGYYSLAELNNEIVGCFMLTHEWSDWRNGRAYWLQSVYVVESYRKHGVFKSMFSYVQQLISSDSQAVGLRLYVDRSNVRAQQVYKAIGMNGDHYMMFELMNC